MEFTTVSNVKRPVRLNEQTRLFAWESMGGRYGNEAMVTADVALDDIPGFHAMSDYQKYDLAINRISEQAPIRICEEERVSGAATLGSAILHMIPAKYKGEFLSDSVSHVTLGFDKVLRVGMNQIEKDIDEQITRTDLSDYNLEILTSMKNTVYAFRAWHKRYLDALKDVKPDIYQLLLQVPFQSARNFHEAVQSLWFTFAFTRLCGNWPGIGRIDEMLGSYLKKDLAMGTLTIEEAREILASLFIKGCEWIRKDTPLGSGDSQHYQNIILAGIDENGNEVTNEVTFLVLDIIEELGISDFPISVRISEQSPRKLLTRTAEVMRHGGGIIAVYNEQLVIDSMVKFGYSLLEARNFANDGCWEVQIPGKTYFRYIPFDCLLILLNDTLNLHDSSHTHFTSFEELYEAFVENMGVQIDRIYRQTIETLLTKTSETDWQWKPAKPCSVVSLFTEGCIEKGLPYLGGGAKYTVVSPHLGGAADVGNSLYAIKKMVYDDQIVSFNTLMEALRNNWEEHEDLQQYARHKYSYYGNDNDESDAIVSRLLSDFARLTEEYNERSPILFPAGVSTFGRQIQWAPNRVATPFGYKKGAILSNNSSPTPGTDSTGATAMIKSYCKADLGRLVCGTALDVKLFPSTVQGKNGIEAIIALLEGFVKLNGFFMQLDIIDKTILRKAQEHPENYRTLSVRVSGWNARFVTLNKEWQEMIISRTEQGV